jgi:hypothetical protein
MATSRRLAAILAAGVARYSWLMGGLELNLRYSAQRGAFARRLY